MGARCLPRAGGDLKSSHMTCMRGRCARVIRFLTARAKNESLGSQDSTRVFQWMAQFARYCWIDA
jgi:hypothetical protein